MCEYPAWLPDLVRLEDYDGDWSRYQDAVYEYFWRDFVESRPRLPNRRIGINKKPLHDGKELSFWHIITNDTGTRREEDRLPNLRRCERIRWPRPIIEALGKEGILYWEAIRNSKPWIVLSLPDFSYLVVFADRGDYALLWSAYPVEFERKLETAKQEYEEYLAKLEG